jgi:hypothetical protein
MAMKLWQHLFHPPTNDPDDARRRRLLNVILSGLLAACLLALLFYVYVALTTDLRVSDPGYRVFAVICLGMAMVGVIYWVGQRWSSKVAGIWLLVLVTILVVMSDTPEELAGGRSSIYFVIPIILSSMLVHPLASFGLAVVTSLLAFWLARQAGVEASFSGYRFFYCGTDCPVGPAPWADFEGAAPDQPELTRRPSAPLSCARRAAPAAETVACKPSCTALRMACWC